MVKTLFVILKMGLCHFPVGLTVNFMVKETLHSGLYILLDK